MYVHLAEQTRLNEVAGSLKLVGMDYLKPIKFLTFFGEYKYLSQYFFLFFLNYRRILCGSRRIKETNPEMLYIRKGC